MVKGDSHKIRIHDEDTFRELFDEYYEGLRSSDEDVLTGFTIAGQDSIFVWAEAKVTDDKVVVNSELVKKPLAVRYAWSCNPACNLTSDSGLTASPFRTDDWKGITE